MNLGRECGQVQPDEPAGRSHPRRERQDLVFHQVRVSTSCMVLDGALAATPPLIALDVPHNVGIRESTVTTATSGMGNRVILECPARHSARPALF